MIEKDTIDGDKRRVELGKEGEDIAVNYLEEQGYEILNRNVQIGHSDIDILAFYEGVLVFVEVRTKSNDLRGMPEETLGIRKLKQMRKTAQHYLVKNYFAGPSRLDAICMIIEAKIGLTYLKHYLAVGNSL